MDATQPISLGLFEQLLEAMPDGVVITTSDGRIAFANRQAETLSGYLREELIGMPVDQLVPETVRKQHLEHRLRYEANPRVRQMGAQLQIRLLRKDGDELPVDVALSPVATEEGPLVVASIRDVTERQRQNARLRALVAVAQAILEGRDQETVLGRIAEGARTMLGSDLAAVAIADPDGESLTVRAADGWRAAAIHDLRIPAQGTLIGEVIASGRPAAPADASEAAALVAPMLDGGGTGPALVVALASGERRHGALILANRAGPPFTGSDIQLAELFAAQAAVAIDHMRARDELQRLAILEDRERIGRELHDGAIQALFAVGMGLQGVAIIASDAALRERLEGSVTQIDEVIRDLRNYIFGLRPGLAADRHLRDALHELGAQLESQHGVTCAVEVDPDVAARLAGRAADLVQLAREALSNVARHASATTCRLALRRQGRSAVLEIDDDGRGFAARQDRRGWGLRNLEERAAALEGALDISSAPGEGTTVRLTIPL